MSLYQIAQKAMLVNISDAIVMNATPKYALLSVALPKTMSKKDLYELSLGFIETAKKYGIKIIGGDTLSNTKLDITITIVSVTKKPIYRNGLKENHLIAYTNQLGSVAKDLKKLLQNKPINQKSKFITPQLNQKYYKAISKFISVSIDISDGLFVELGRLSKINKKGVHFFSEFNKSIGCSGEEYEILFGFSPKNLNAIRKISQQHRVKLNIVGKTKKGSFKNRCLNHHFKA